MPEFATATSPAPAMSDRAIATGLSQRRKAAMVIQLLLADGQKLSLSTMSEDHQLALARELGSLRVVDRTTLNQVATEFFAQLQDVALAAPGTIDGALAALSGQISPATAARLRDEESRRAGHDPWALVLALEPGDLIGLMEKESTQICAVTLSKLPVSKAAAVLGLLPGERARRITFAMSQTAAVTPDAVRRIGQSLAIDYGTRPLVAFAMPPSQRVGAILNSSQPATRDQMLDALTADDPTFADQVRKAIFTFPDITTRLAAADIPKVIRGIDNATLVTALAAAQADGGAMSDVVDFLLANMSQRMADQLREDIRDRGRVRKTDGEAAQSDLIGAIRAKVDSGEIALVIIEDED